MKVRHFHIILLVLISALFGYYLGVSRVSFEWQNYKPSAHIVNREPPPNQKNIDFSLFWTVLAKIEETYYDKKALDSKKLLNGAISGMVQSLGDPYTIYLPPTQNNDFKQGMAGQQFEGIGAELGMQGKQIVVIAPLDGNAAQKAGVLPGDAILKVNDQLTNGWTLAQAVEKIRGPKGTTVTLTVVHKNKQDPSVIKIKREAINIKSVTGWIKNIEDAPGIKDEKLKSQFGKKKIAYVKISQFGDKTNEEWTGLVSTLALSMKDNDVVGLVVDVRNNPGGYLNDATFIASEFFDGTVVVQEKGSGERAEFPSVRKGLLTEVPIVVLINKGSASASEIVAGALRDHKRAILVGETSFGKGTIQQAEDIGVVGAGLHVTVAKWLTPNGTWVHGKGLTPDVSVAVDEKDSLHDAQLEKAVLELVK